MAEFLLQNNFYANHFYLSFLVLLNNNLCLHLNNTSILENVLIKM